MNPLVVKLPAIGKRRAQTRHCTNKTLVEKDKSNSKSTARVAAWRLRQKQNPNLDKVFNAKKLEQNQKSRQKIKDARASDPSFDRKMKMAQKTWKKNQRRREQEKKAKKESDNQKKTTKLTESESCTAGPSSSTTRKRAQRVKEKLPSSPQSWAQTMKHVIKHATPRRKSMIQEVFDQTAPAMLNKDKPGRPTKEDAIVRRKLFLKSTAEDSGIYNRTRYLKRQKTSAGQISKSDQYHQKWQPTIIEFLESQSRIMPNKKDTILIEGERVAKRHLIITKHQAYTKFKAIHPAYDRKYITFFKSIPKNFKVLNETCRRMCICTKCYNLEQRVVGINQVCQKLIPNLRSSLRELSRSTLCDYSKIPKRECVDRLCSVCGTASILNKYQPLIDASRTPAKMVKYHQWNMQQETYKDRQGVQKTTKKWKQIEKSQTVESTVTEIISDMIDYTKHIFRNDHQYHVQTNMSQPNHLPLSHCAVIMDFSENYALTPQDEIESAHWAQTQVTIHPIFIIRHSPDSTVDNPRLLKESLIIISNHLAHNNAAVYTFTNQLLTHIRNNPGPCPVEVVHRWSDNCATQYKCIDAFSHIPQIEQMNDVKIIYNFSESGHGKGQSDGLGATTKAKLDRLILGGQLITNAYQAYLALVQNESKVQRKKDEKSVQRFLYVSSKMIAKDSPKKLAGLKSIKGTQGFHMVQSCVSSPTVALECSDLSCDCLPCMTHTHFGPCHYGMYRLQDKLFLLQSGKQVTRLQLTTPTTKDNSATRTQPRTSSKLPRFLYKYIF